MNEATDAPNPGVNGETPIPDWPVNYRIRRAMDVADLDVDELADALGVSPVTIYNYVKGATRPRRAALTIIAGMAGIPLWWLEGHDTPPPDAVVSLQGKGRRRHRTQGVHVSRCIHVPSLAA